MRRQIDIRGALHAQQSRTNQKHKSHKGRHRVPRQAEEELVALAAENERLARLDIDLPKILFAPDGFEGLLHIIKFPDGYAAAGHHHLVFVERFFERLFRVGDLIADNGIDIRLGANALDERCEHGAIAFENFAFVRRAAGLLQFAARRKQTHLQPAKHTYFRNAKCAHEPDKRRRNEVAFAHHHVALANVLALEPYIFIRLHWFENLNFVRAAFDGVFLHHDGVRTTGHGRASEKADRCFFLDALAPNVPGGDFPDDLQFNGLHHRG